MEESMIIWKFLAFEFPDDHQAVSVYCKDSPRTYKTAENKVLELVTKVFGTPSNQVLIKKVIIAYFEEKRKRYLKGELKLNSVY